VTAASIGAMLTVVVPDDEDEPPLPPHAASTSGIAISRYGRRVAIL
jgi:hypothetical protein